MAIEYTKGSKSPNTGSSRPSNDEKNARRKALRGLLLPGIFALVGLIVLVSLGNWQLRRLAFKEYLAGQITKRLTQPPTSLSAAEVTYSKNRKIAEYTRVSAMGEYLHDKELHLYALRDKKSGWYVVTPLKLEDGRVLLVNRGFVPEPRKDPKTRANGQISGTVKAVGLLRAPPKSAPMFSPDNNPKRNRWFKLDINQMAKSVLPTGTKMLPFVIETEEKKKGVWPAGGATRLNFENRHMAYALTWYGLAASLLGVFGFFAWGRLTS